MSVMYLRDEVKIWDESGLENDGHVRGVEQLDGVRTLLPTGVLWSHRQNHTEPLEVDHNQEDQDCG